MPRSLALSNGRTYLAWDARYRLADATWPHVGDPNHLLGRACRVGVRVGRSFRWLPEGFRGSLGYEPGAATTRATFTSDRLGVALAFEDALHAEEDLLVRRVVVRDRRGERRRVDVFLHHDLAMGGVEHGNAVAHDPVTGGLVHWRDGVYALANATDLDQVACGVTRFGDLEGTWRDAEDGELSGNPIAHGSVDSVFRIRLDVPPRGEARAFAWLAFGGSLDAVRRLDALARRRPAAAARTARAAARSALAAAPKVRETDLPAGVRALYERSVLLVRALADRDGAVLAAVDADILSFNRDVYAYVWPRDGAFVARALHAVGARELAAAHLAFLAACPRDDGVAFPAARGALLHKYTVARHPASSWHAWARAGVAEAAIQEDETGLALWALARAAPARVRRELWKEAGRAWADALVAFRDAEGLPLPSWDLWEERRGVHLFTCAAVHAGLHAAADLAKAAGDTARARAYVRASEEVRRAALEALWIPGEGRYARRLDEDGSPDATPDASMVALVTLGMTDARDARTQRTLDTVFRLSEVPGKVGGTARYPGDLYHRATDRSNPWVICTLWRGLWELAKGNRPGLARALRWCVARAGPTGHLAEQYHPATGEPLSVSPLTWSHATFAEATLAYARS